MATARGLLLDIGGVVLVPPTMLLSRLAEREPRLQAVLTPREMAGGAIGEDPLWDRVMRREIGRRDYWVRRATEFGRAVGERWTPRDLMERLYDGPPEEWLCGPVRELMHQVRAAGLPLAALTNDLAALHGDDWQRQQYWLTEFDVIVDASRTGFVKPDPRAYAAGARVLGLPPEEVVYLDDQPWNVEEGAMSGLCAVRVDPYRPQEAVRAARDLLGLPPLGDRDLALSVDSAPGAPACR